jgi:hypothetical protein
VAFASAPVTVATTATALHASDADGQSLLVSNVGAATVYLGPAGVTTSTGVPLAANASVSINGLAGGEVLAVILTNGG